MRLLIISQYYPPENGAPQNRLSGLAAELKKSGHQVEVLTAMPNYPAMKIRKEYKGKFFLKEVLNDITLYRGWIYASESRSFIGRLANYFSFVFVSYIISFRIKGRFDYVLCESPPLFLGISAVHIAKRKKAKFIFNVSDLWPESAEKLGLVSNTFLLSLSYRLEKWLYNKSFLITGQTQGICKSIQTRFPEKRVHWLPNGIDPGNFDLGENVDVANDSFKDLPFVVMYAGIIGHAQGLEVIIEAAKILKDDRSVQFVLVGDGPEKLKLEQLVIQNNLNNVRFTGLIAREFMPDILRTCDAAVIPLRKLDLFKGAIPSKIFENLAMKKPVLLGVDGEAKTLFVEKGKCSLFFEPENAQDLAEKVVLLKTDTALQRQLTDNGWKFVHEYFDRKKITLDFLNAIGS